MLIRLCYVIFFLCLYYNRIHSEKNYISLRDARRSNSLYNEYINHKKILYWCGNITCCKFNATNMNKKDLLLQMWKYEGNNYKWKLLVRENYDKARDRINKAIDDGVNYIGNIISKPLNINMNEWPLIDYTEYDKSYGSGSFKKLLCDNF